jgi:hypothetical protein
MPNFVVKIKEALAQIESEKGSFTLKCLVSKNSDFDMKWDLVLSAEWFDHTGEMERLNYLAKKVFANLDNSDLFDFSAIITYKTTESTPLIECLKDISEKMLIGKLSDSSNYGGDVSYSLRACRGLEREVVSFL